MQHARIYMLAQSVGGARIEERNPDRSPQNPPVPNPTSPIPPAAPVTMAILLAWICSDMGKGGLIDWFEAHAEARRLRGILFLAESLVEGGEIFDGIVAVEDGGTGNNKVGLHRGAHPAATAGWRL